MLDLFENSENKVLNYFNVQNLSFDHPLTSSEIEEFKTIIFSINDLTQIYFKGTIDLKSIEIIKNLLLISGFIDDSMIEKCVAVILPKDDMNKLLNSTYKNPETWKIAYNVENNNYVLTSIPKCRKFFTYINRIKYIRENEKLSDFETVLRIYDIVKLYDFDNEEKNSNLSDIVEKGKASSLGFNKLFAYILNGLNFKTFVGKEKSQDGKYSYITAVLINDEKYAVHGIYLFDPSMDSLPKDIYKNDDIRMINYNYFGLLFSGIENTSYNDRLSGVFGILACDDFDYGLERREDERNVSMQKEFSSIEKAFGMSYMKLYSKVKKTKSLSFDKIEEAINNVYGEERNVKNYYDLIKENYFSRKNELFIPTTEETLEELLSN